MVSVKYTSFWSDSPQVTHVPSARLTSTHTAERGIGGMLTAGVCAAFLFFVSPFQQLAVAAPAVLRSQVADSAKKALLEGKTVRSITVVVRDIFDEPNPTSFYRTANSLKFTTKESVVRRELLVKEGQEYDQFKVEESIRNLRALGYLSNVEIIPKVDGDAVDLEVRCQDTWTFIPTFGYSSGTGSNNLQAGLSESDLLGHGKRAEFLYREQDGRKGYEAVYDDDRLWGSSVSFVGGLFQRNDGHREVFELGTPFRSLSQKESWSLLGDESSTVGRLWQNGDVRYIYRQEKDDFGIRYSVADGEPEATVRRFSLGYYYSSARFSQADQGDYDDLNLDPDEVSNDPQELAENRRFSGPVLAFESIKSDFISLDYIDRFERVQDYNLGATFSASVQLAPEFLGSRDDAALLNANRSFGVRVGSRGFVRGEIGVNSRLANDRFENSLARAEVKFYRSFLPSYIDDLYVGRHTLASSVFIDYGDRLDRDREFLAGSDNLLRGYEANTFAGNKRVGMNIEDRVHFVDDIYDLVSMGGAAFFDLGGASNRALGTLLTRDLYADVGVGLRFAFPKSSGGRTLRIDLAFPLRDGPDGSGAWQLRAVLQGGQLFDSRLRSESLGAERSNIVVGTDR
ncbi:MAG: hypothetical protein EBZ48_05645 [Proteobacteria bacterium]|nr:hypothetical protein [Pseudomonadota bacterium]